MKSQDPGFDTDSKRRWQHLQVQMSEESLLVFQLLIQLKDP
jgi:hypothetical protein